MWSWILMSVGLLGLWLAGSNNRLGWALGIFAQVLWIIYAIQTSQYGFIISALAYGAVYARNFKKWKVNTQ